MLALAEARANKTKIDWKAIRPATPRKPGITVLENYPLDELTRYIDWTPFFITWEMKGRYPAILTDEKAGVEATKLFNDAQALLQAHHPGKIIHGEGRDRPVPGQQRGRR